MLHESPLAAEKTNCLLVSTCGKKQAFAVRSIAAGDLSEFTLELV